MPQTMSIKLPIPANEAERLMNLADLNVDFTDFNESFKGLTNLAAKIAGTEISLVNLIDTYTQWSVSNFGIDIQQMPREDSVCQYTIMGDDFFEVRNLSLDERFKDKDYVAGPLALNYYMGYPLKTDAGNNIGALCFLDKETKDFNDSQKEQLKLIANELVARLKTYKQFSLLQNKLAAQEILRKKLAHDIRGPLAGIIGLSQVIKDKGEKNRMSEVLEYVGLINTSSSGLLNATDEILLPEAADNEQPINFENYNLTALKSNLETLFKPQATKAGIHLSILADEATAHLAFGKNNTTFLASEMVAYMIRRTTKQGLLKVRLSLKYILDKGFLQISMSNAGKLRPDNETDAQALEFINTLVKVKKGTITNSIHDEIGSQIVVRFPL